MIERGCKNDRIAYLATTLKVYNANIRFLSVVNFQVYVEVKYVELTVTVRIISNVVSLIFFGGKYLWLVLCVEEQSLFGCK